MFLSQLEIGKTACITKVGGEGALRQHFLDMGMIPGTDVKLVKYAPMGDPMEIRISGYELTIRLADAEKIEIENVRLVEEQQEEKSSYDKIIPHPAIGEYDSRDHSREHRDAQAKKGKLTFALVGNQNSGKTTLFNQLTGSNQHVGNFPGVTVDRKSGRLKGTKR